MRTGALVGLLASGLGGWAADPGAVSPARAGQPGSIQFGSDIQPVVAQYCYGCHGAQQQKAGVSLHEYRTDADARQGRAVWAKVLRVLSQREMPPEGKPQPDAAERERVMQWLRRELFPLDCAHPDPGRVTLRRLNRAEYNNTIRDLVGIDFAPAEDFPADDSGYGFDNIGDVLSLSPLLLEKYLAAAERILDAAIVTPESRRAARQMFAAATFVATGGGSVDGCCFRLYSAGAVAVNYTAARAGAYRLRVRGYGEQAGPEPARMAISVDDEEVKTIEVSAVEASPKDYDVELKLQAGRRRLAAAFVNDYYNPNDPNPANRDRNLVVQSFEIEGPLEEPPPALPATHRRIFVCESRPGTEAACLRTILGQFARRAFRRPPTDPEVERLVGLAQSARQAGESFESSVKVALAAILVSPSFLFRGEEQPEPDNPQAVHPISAYALASRLSYFLWSSMPDEELLQLAEGNRLRADLEGQVHRLLRDPKATALVEQFGGQWLQIRNLALASPDAREFPSFDAELRTAMRRETELLFAHIVREDRSVLEFLTADYTFVNERLAKLYGLPGVKGESYRRVALAGTARGGVLTHASVLTITSNPTRTSPVKRGKWVLENLLNAPPPPPPPNVPALKEGQAAAAGATLRQRMEQHRADPACASCHALMDPIGFGLENFDGIGAWREREGGQAIDSSGMLNTGETFTGPAELRQLLATAKRDQFVRCLAEKLLTYALGRGLEYYDQCAVDRIVQNLARAEYRFSALVMEIVKSVPFQMRRGEGERLVGEEG